MAGLVLRKPKPNVSSSRGYTIADPVGAGIFLQELLGKTVKLKETDKDSCLYNDFDCGTTLDVLEADLNATISTLKKKEGDLQHAEQKIVADHFDLNHTKLQIEMSNQEISFAYGKQKELKKDLEKANKQFVSQAKQIEDLKQLISKRDEEIIALKSALCQKEKELSTLQQELSEKNKYVEKMNLEIMGRHLLLNDANEMIESQKVEIEELKQEVRLKEENLTKFIHARKIEKEALRAAETKLEMQVCVWSAAMKDIEDLTVQATKGSSGVGEVAGDFKRVSELLSAVQCELMSFRGYIASCKSNLMDDTQLERYWQGINEENFLVASYVINLNKARLEIEDERSKLEVAEAQISEFRSKLSIEGKVSEALKKQLNKEKCLLEEKNKKINALQMELQLKELSFQNACDTIQKKERELTEARVEIQNLKNEQVSLRSILEKKDADHQNAQRMLVNLSNEITVLQNLLKNKEDQLVQLAARLEEKENYTLKVQHDLEKETLKFSEASAMIQRIFQLTSRLAVSTDQVGVHLEQSEDADLITETKDVGIMSIQKLEQEMKMTKARLRAKELEVCSLQAIIRERDGLHCSHSKQDSALKIVQKTTNTSGNDVCFDIPEEGMIASSGFLKSNDVYGDFSKQRVTKIASFPEKRNGRNKLLEAEKELATLLSLTERLVREV